LRPNLILQIHFFQDGLTSASADENNTEREAEDVSASPVVARAKREQSSQQQNDFGFTDLQDFKPPHFKGIIQDIRVRESFKAGYREECFYCRSTM
jgi:predicted restriction endonuclease